MLSVYFIPKIISTVTRGGSRTAATSKMELFVIIVNYYHRVLHLGCCSSPRSVSGNTLQCAKMGHDRCCMGIYDNHRRNPDKLIVSSNLIQSRGISSQRMILKGKDG